VGVDFGEACLRCIDHDCHLFQKWRVAGHVSPGLEMVVGKLHVCCLDLKIEMDHIIDAFRGKYIGGNCLLVIELCLFDVLCRRSCDFFSCLRIGPFVVPVPFRIRDYTFNKL
jgi:hypothetical protein